MSFNLINFCTIPFFFVESNFNRYLSKINPIKNKFYIKKQFYNKNINYNKIKYKRGFKRQLYGAPRKN